jgi:uncharacterized protein YaiI (UPF0178 family)
MPRGRAAWEARRDRLALGALPLGYRIDHLSNDRTAVPTLLSSAFSIILPMRLWLDADAAPRDVKDVCLRAAERLKLETILVANQRLPLPPGYVHVSAVRVDGGPDVADRYIAEHAEAGDVAVTADIPLAALLVPKGVVVIDPRGEEYSAESIGERLSVRNFMDGLRGAGVETGGHASYGARDKQKFSNALDRALTRALRGR